MSPVSSNLDALTDDAMGVSGAAGRRQANDMDAVLISLENVPMS